MSQETIENVDESAPITSNIDRRASVRLQSNAKGYCQSLSRQHEADWQAKVRDISCSGIGLLIPRRFEIGTLLTIEIAGAGKGQEHLLVAKVVHAAMQPDGTWFFGCSFASPLAEHEVQLLLGNAS